MDEELLTDTQSQNSSGIYSGLLNDANKAAQDFIRQVDSYDKTLREQMLRLTADNILLQGQIVILNIELAIKDAEIASLKKDLAAARSQVANMQPDTVHRSAIHNENNKHGGPTLI